MNQIQGSDRRGGVALRTRIGTALALAFAIAGVLGTTACSSMPPPFGTPYQGFRGYKARTFVGTPEEVRPAVIETLRGLGYEVLIDGADTTYLSAVRGMDRSSYMGSDTGSYMGSDTGSYMGSNMEPDLGAELGGDEGALDGEVGTAMGGQREWTRVGVQIRLVDKHRRAPRTLVEVEAERVQGSSEGAIEASFGAGKVTSEFYQSFFREVEARVEEARPRRIYGLRPPA